MPTLLLIALALLSLLGSGVGVFVAVLLGTDAEGRGGNIIMAALWVAALLLIAFFVCIGIAISRAV